MLEDNHETNIESKVIGDIYKATYKPDHWPVALEGIARYTFSSSSALLTQDNEIQRSGGTYLYNIPDEHIVEYSKIEGGDPNFAIMAERGMFGVAAALDHVVPDRNQLESIYGQEYTDFVIKTDYYYQGGALLFMDDVRSAAIALQRKRSMGLWDKSQIERLNSLIPHLQQALTIQKEFIRLQTREQAMQNGLDKLLMGLILFDTDLRPIYVNHVAKSILKYHPAISMRNEKIYAHKYRDTEKIHSALVKASSFHSSTDLSAASTTFGIQYNGYGPTLPVIISPVNGMLSGFENESTYANAVMCFSDPERTIPIETDKLAEVYGLTSAEAKVAVSIANGLSVENISVINDVAISTIRSQLQAIYNKLGINQQTELVKILLTCPFTNKI